MISCRGGRLTPEVKKIAVSVKQYFEQNKIEPAEPSVKRTADALGIGIASVKRIMADYNRDPDSLDNPAKMRGRPAHAVSASHQESVRSYIRAANKNGEHITLGDIDIFLKKTCPGESFHKATLARTLGRWGFEFGKGVRSQHLKEKDHVVAARQRYLRELRSNRIHGQGGGSSPLFGRRFIWMNRMLTKTTVTISVGITAKTGHGFKSQQAKKENAL